MKNYFKSQMKNILIVCILLQSSFLCVGCNKKVEEKNIFETEISATEISEKKDTTTEFVKKKVEIDYYKIPEVYLEILTDEEIEFYNKYVTAFLNFEPKVEQKNADKFLHVWSLIGRCFFVSFADLDTAAGYDMDDQYVYMNYLSNSKAEHDKLISEFEERVQYFYEDIDESEEGAKLARHLYDNFTGTLEYNYDVVHNNTFDNVTGYTAIMYGDGVCASFSSAYSFLARQVGFETFQVDGPNHEWGAIKLDGKYYFVDPTWDSNCDPIYSQYFGIGLDKRIKDGFPEEEMFVCGSDEFKLSEYVKIERENYQ